MRQRLVFAVAFATTVAPASAASQRHRPHRPHRPPAQVAPARPASSFYPESIEGGVTGNLPFNNQIRKLRDPLNANGAGR